MTEEHDLPTEKPAEESPQVKQARLWLHLDGVAHKIEEAAKELREGAEGAGASGKPVSAQIHAAEHANVNHTQFTEHSKLLPWLILTTVLSGIALGISIMVVVNTIQSESRTRAELDKQNRFLQEYRIRVEDAEIAAEEVNPKFHPRRTE